MRHWTLAALLLLAACGDKDGTGGDGGTDSSSGDDGGEDTSSGTDGDTDTGTGTDGGTDTSGGDDGGTDTGGGATPGGCAEVSSEAIASAAAPAEGMGFSVQGALEFMGGHFNGTVNLPEGNSFGSLVITSFGEGSELVTYEWEGDPPDTGEIPPCDPAYRVPVDATLKMGGDGQVDVSFQADVTMNTISTGSFIVEIEQDDFSGTSEPTFDTSTVASVRFVAFGNFIGDGWNGSANWAGYAEGSQVSSEFEPVGDFDFSPIE